MQLFVLEIRSHNIFDMRAGKMEIQDNEKKETIILRPAAEGATFLTSDLCSKSVVMIPQKSRKGPLQTIFFKIETQSSIKSFCISGSLQLDIDLRLMCLSASSIKPRHEGIGTKVWNCLRMDLESDMYHIVQNCDK